MHKIFDRFVTKKLKRENTRTVKPLYTEIAREIEGEQEKDTGNIKKY